MEKKVMIVAGESSGDLHGAYLVKSIKKIRPEVSFFGLGGSLMKEAGVEVIFDLTQESIIGLVEAIKIFPKIFKVYQDLKKLILKNPPHLLVLIDFPEFNLYLAKFASQQNIPVIYYLPPTVWAWREKRAKKIAQRVNEVMTIFPFEKQVYDKYKVKSTYIGHPLIDIVKVNLTKEEIFSKLPLNKEVEYIGLLPGSRKSEVKKILPILFQAAKILKKNYPKLNFLIPLARSLTINDLYEVVNEEELRIINAQVIKEDHYEVMSICKLLIVASGTATLEAMILSVPMIIVYKVNWLTWVLGKLLVRLRYFGLPNIIAGKKIIPEMFQGKATPQLISKKAADLLLKEKMIKEQKKEMKMAATYLGEVGVIDRAARIIESYLR
ncbi:lipid-A-disaccharide synthase [bacterium]|nr:lipid-A-disaccharide synthase [bacterium]